MATPMIAGNIRRKNISAGLQLIHMMPVEILRDL